jgi:phage gp29-like protein
MANNGYPAGTKLGPSGYPVGSLPDSPHAHPIPADQLGAALQKSVGGRTTDITRNDVAFQQPTDPLLGGDRPELVYRDIPIISTITSWTVPTVRNSLRSMMEGVFDGAGQFCDAVLGDDRVQATMGSRLAGLWGREVRIKPANDSRAAREVADAWEAHWSDLELEGCSGFQETAAYGILMGSAYGQVVWDTTGPLWKPYPRPWHPRYTFFHWPTRKFVAITQDGLVAIVPGNGKWYGCQPFGGYRSWVRGALRALAEPWLGLRFSRRDWWRFNEVHGIPTRVGYTPAAADPGERSQFENQLGQLGSETTLLVPRGVDKDLGYGYELVEAKDTNWESFERTINECHLAVVLILKWQNLTTEITAGGSYAAAKEHGHGEVSQTASDNTVWRSTIRRDLARPFALYNFGDADLAPITDRDVPLPPREDYSGNADVFGKVAAALSQLSTAGFSFGNTEELSEWVRRKFGLASMPSITMGDSPAMVTAKAAETTANQEPEEANEEPTESKDDV